MRLEQVFDRGHHLGCSRDGTRRAVLREAIAGRPAGYYFLNPGAAEVASVRRRFEEDDLNRRLKIQDLALDEWIPDVDHCWCQQCVETRQFRGTLGDTE